MEALVAYREDRMKEWPRMPLRTLMLRNKQYGTIHETIEGAIKCL